MKIVKYRDLDESFFEAKPFGRDSDVDSVLYNVKKYGDKAVREYSKKFGDGDLADFEVSKEEIEKAVTETPEEILEAIKISIKNVKTFAEKQFSILKDVELHLDKYSVIGHKVVPLERIGAYVPGGRYPLPSSAVMSVVPAKVAGVKEVIVCSPKIQEVTIAAAHMAGADRIFRVGGVQAIGAMAYGTETIPAVDKITGPGNSYVTAAKKAVYGECGIDFLAGPSEVMIIADETAVAEYVTADILAQLEHDVEACAYLVTTSESLARHVIHEKKEFVKALKTKEIIQKSLENFYVIIVEDIEQAIEIANRKAPEHLEICFKGAEEEAEKFRNYGSLFVGNYSAEVFGDYCSGTNHILPTNRVARYSGGLSVFDFVKIQTYQNISHKTVKSYLSKTASIIAKTEGLWAHKLSADVRD